jgi:hypothetical protein
MYLGVTFDRRMTWRHHIESTVAKALLTHVRTNSLFKSGLYKALVKSVMTYACSTWGHAADAHLLKLQRLQNRVLCAIGNLDRRISVCELHVAFKFPYVYDYVTKLFRTQ